MSIISIKDLTFTYPGAATATLRNLNLEVAEGDFLAIMGANGCGKSTLCKAMNGLIPECGKYLDLGMGRSTMYSKQDKERILADWRASGLTATSFCRIPGNP
ncbi:ATP-binding cassette domain-containing protein, partial [Enorma sp.]|uniref:ATP-binding cassette domain-containing protein n=1 Tax=Enorma sp. TaxID=1920692 RepID=UPI003AB6A9C5